MRSQKIKDIKVSDLVLWTENPRDPIDLDSSDFDIISRAIEDDEKKWDLKKFLEEMGTYYDFSELPTVVQKGKKFIVYDGNRRIAILKYLQNENLYAQLNGGLFYSQEPKELKELKRIPCNICDEQTALDSIERKHINDGSWGALERDYFLYLHRNEQKSILIWLHEQGLLENTKKMNQRFVKEEVLKTDNLKRVGFKYIDTEELMHSMYNQEKSEEILAKMIDLIERGKISTRKNRHKLYEPLLEEFPELSQLVHSFDETKSVCTLEGKKVVKNGTDVRGKNENVKKSPHRKTQESKPKDILFGKILNLEQGKVNDMYRAIDTIYNRNRNSNAVLAIVAMSLRLILEVAARVYSSENDLSNIDDDKIYKEFLKSAKSEMTKQQIIFISISHTAEWINGKVNLEAMLGKYAHGNIEVSKSDILVNSAIVGDILEFYFKK